MASVPRPCPILLVTIQATDRRRGKSTLGSNKADSTSTQQQVGGVSVPVAGGGGQPDRRKPTTLFPNDDVPCCPLLFLWGTGDLWASIWAPLLYLLPPPPTHLLLPPSSPSSLMLGGTYRWITNDNGLCSLMWELAIVSASSAERRTCTNKTGAVANLEASPPHKPALFTPGIKFDAANHHFLRVGVCLSLNGGGGSSGWSRLHLLGSIFTPPSAQYSSLASAPGMKPTSLFIYR